MRTAGIIPARYGASRLPGKPIQDIQGRPMIWWVYQKAIKAKRLDQVLVAADDERIMEECSKWKIPAVLTGTSHRNAASRLQEVSERIVADFYVQINGDEPLIRPEYIDAVIPETISTEEEFGTNIIAPVASPAEVLDPSNIKVVFDVSLRALYMSRTPIPNPFLSIDVTYYKHVGILGYNKKMLDFYKNSVPGTFEKIEGIDTLRFLDYGKHLQFIVLEEVESLSVDTPKDLEYVRKLLQREKDIVETGNKKSR